MRKYRIFTLKWALNGVTVSLYYLYSNSFMMIKGFTKNDDLEWLLC